MRGQNSITKLVNTPTRSSTEIRGLQPYLHRGVPVVKKWCLTAVRHNTTSAVIDRQSSQRFHRYCTAVSMITTDCSKISSSCLNSPHTLDPTPTPLRSLSIFQPPQRTCQILRHTTAALQIYSDAASSLG